MKLFEISDALCTGGCTLNLITTMKNNTTKKNNKDMFRIYLHRTLT